jgi:hypothetical protein
LHPTLETSEVVTDGHGQGEEFFEGLLGMGELDDDAAGFEADARRQIFELLVEELGGRFDQQAGALPALLFQLGQLGGDLLAAALFVVMGIAVSKEAKVGDEGVPVCEAVGAEAAGYAGSQDLLGAAATYAEERFDGGAVDERAGKGFEGFDYLGNPAIPEGFGGHGYFCMLVRTCAKCNDIER